MRPKTSPLPSLLKGRGEEEGERQNYGDFVG